MPVKFFLFIFNTIWVASKITSKLSSSNCPSMEELIQFSTLSSKALPSSKPSPLSFLPKAPFAKYLVGVIQQNQWELNQQYSLLPS